MNKHLTFNRLALIFVLLLLNTNIYGQKKGKELIDSLQKRITAYSSSCKYTCLKDSTKVILLLDLAWEYNNSKPDTVPVLCSEALALSKNIKYANGMAQSHHVLGVYFYSRKEDYVNAMKSFNDELAILDELLVTKKNTKLILSKKAACLNSISNIYSAKSDFGNAVDFLEKALKINEGYDNWEGVAINNSNIGNIYFDLGDYPKSLEHHLKALRIIEKNNINRILAPVLGRVGRVYRTMGDLPKALEYYYKAFDTNKKNNDKNGMGINYQSIGLVYHSQNNIPKELECYSNALALFTEIKRKAGIATINNSLGTVYNDKAGNQTKLGENDSALANYQIALTYFLEAAKIQEASAKNTNFADYLGNIGMAYAGLNKYDDAEKYLLDALKLAESLEYLDGIKSANEQLSELYLKSGKYEKAMTHYKKSVVAKDSLFSESNTENKIRMLGMNYEFDKKQEVLKAEYEKKQALSELEKQVAISEANKKRLLSESERRLQVSEAENKRLEAETANKELSQEMKQQQMKTNFERKEAQQKIQLANTETQLQKQKALRYSIIGGSALIVLASVFGFIFYKRNAEQKQKETSLNLQVSETEMKALRSQMNPHFIFNALQSIQTFLLNHKPDDANTYLLKFSKLMRLVLENSQHSEVPLKEDMKALELYMQLESIRLIQPFTFQFHIADGIDLEETTIPPLILQPFVENAIWHGLQYKPEPGHIDIYINKNGDTLHAIVEDNGVGRDMSKNVTQPMLLKKESLGMKLTEERLKVLNELKKIKAHFKITDLFTKDKQPAGTKVELSLPI